jgi:eukaryotic-like serine/threonine-protein kinase
MTKSSQFSFDPGQWISGTPYRVVRPLGLGGMGEVYEVDHTHTGTRRALKILRESTDRRGNAAQRLLREGQALSRIDHRNVVRVFDVGTLNDGRPFFAMQLLEGRTVRGVCNREGPVDVVRAVHLMAQALRGLQAVHEQDIVHRDVKPTNLFVCNGDRLKVLDFGVAKVTCSSMSAPSTAEGLVLGTLRYMAPEQLSGARVGPQADVYAVALVLFELIAGRHPFQSEQGVDRPVLSRLREPAPDLSSLAPRPLPSGIEAAVSRALQMDPSRRYPTAVAFERALLDCVAVKQSIPADLDSRSRPLPAALRWQTELPTEPWSTVRHRVPNPACSARRGTPTGTRALIAFGLAASVCSLALAGAAAAIALRGSGDSGRSRLSAAQAALLAAGVCGSASHPGVRSPQ